jgi:phenylpropionate dioxygenase-like ring-hydroxylating dioxygenase large terminal subunit
MMFLRNCWYVAGWSHHIAADGMVSRTMLDEPIVLYRKTDGGVVALEDRSAATASRHCRAGA